MDNQLMSLPGPHKRFEEIRKVTANGIEYWEARELMPLLEYSKWENFLSVIDRAKSACSKSGQMIEDHFPEIKKMIKIAIGTVKESKRNIVDFQLSRYACYLIAQNGDPSKQAIATAQTYFAIQARKQELFEKLNEDEKRLFLRENIRVHNKKLNRTASKAGVENFGKFNSMGYVGLYGMSIDHIKQKKGIGDDDILDRAGSTELAANLFRITQTDEKIKNENIHGEGKATYTHLRIGQKVRQTIKEIGGKMPEELPAEPNIKHLKKGQQSLLKEEK